MQLIRLLLIAFILLILSGCRIEISVPEGGTVETLSGNYTCGAGEKCAVEVNDLFFDETFIARPGEGYTFSHWIKQPRGLCGGLTTPCHLFTSLFEGNETLTSFLASTDVFFLEPVFTDCSGGTMYSGTTSQQRPISFIVCKNTVTHLDFVYQQLGEIPPDPACRHKISVNLSAPLDSEGRFAADVSVPVQTSNAGKLRLVAFEARLSGSLADSGAVGRWDFTELEILCEKSTGETIRNFCGERFLPCIDAIDFSFNAK